MAGLPNARQAIIDPAKIKDYILSPIHPLGRFKAAYFQSIGYTLSNWHVFESELARIAASGQVSKSENTQYGEKYLVEGDLTIPQGGAVKVITVWVILNNDSIPRFITVYPGDRK